MEYGNCYTMNTSNMRVYDGGPPSGLHNSPLLAFCPGFIVSTSHPAWLCFALSCLASLSVGLILPCFVLPCLVSFSVGLILPCLALLCSKILKQE